MYSLVRNGVIAISAIALIGCGTLPPKSMGENNSSFSYIPLDPLPIDIDPRNACTNSTKSNSELLDILPDQAVRIAIGQYNTSGTLIYGPINVGVEGEKYQVVLDYISVDASNILLTIQKSTHPEYVSAWRRVYLPWTVTREDFYSTKYEVVHAEPLSMSNEAKEIATQSEAPNPAREIIVYPPKKVTIPVYVGVGLRLTANVIVNKGKANLSSLGSISAAAEAGNVSGSLVVQTLGITGKSIATALPLPSEINPTTIQNAILALGTIKSGLYNKEDITVSPRVVGIYNPIGGGADFVNDVVSLLAQMPPKWSPPCRPKDAAQQVTPADRSDAAMQPQNGG